MPTETILTQLPFWANLADPPKTLEKAPDLHTLWQQPALLPACVTTAPTLLRYLDLLGPLRWAEFPERDLHPLGRFPPVPYAAFVATELLRVNEGLGSAGTLHRYLLEHPGFIWLLGYPCVPRPASPLGFNALASLPTAHHFTYLLRHTPNAVFQWALADSVQLIRVALAQRGVVAGGDCNSLDTKHILAWVKENNPKAYLAERFNPTRQPGGDADCRLGCKRQHPRPTPTNLPHPATRAQIGEYHWGYASGVVVTAVPPWGEFVLAELTQPFDQGDVTYFFPLMTQVEARLGYRPHYGLFDAGFDAWYVYAYFYRENDPASGYAAVPLVAKGGPHSLDRQFAPNGAPRCAAHYPMCQLFTYTSRASGLVAHERAKYGCPLRFPTRTGETCPVQHPRWHKGGCTVMMPTSIGARLRYQLDRTSRDYRERYRLRAAVERINSQATALGIERPHWRNAAAIANQNTLIYTLINLRFLQRLARDWPIQA